MATLKDITNGIMTASAKKFGENSLFSSDVEVTDVVPVHAVLMQLDSTSSDYGLTENVLIIDNEHTPFLCTAKTATFNGDVSVSYSTKQLNLNGLYYFVNKHGNNDEFYKLNDCFDKFLAVNKIDVKFEDIVDLFEYNPEYDVNILQFESLEGFTTITAKNGLLKKISVKGTQKHKIKSAF